MTNKNNAKKKTDPKRVSNPFSTGGGGANFESEVQASFVALMLTGGYAPCLRSRWPIVEIKLQGRVAGYETDDLIVVMENPSSKERRRLLCQVKHSITITKGRSLLGEVLQAAWNDYRNPAIFNKHSDAIALITGPISETDHHNVSWLLNQAKHTKDADEFFFNIQQTNFSPSKAVEKLNALKHHLTEANDRVALSNEELFEFLKHFHLIGYDLDNMHGVAASLLHSHFSQFQLNSPLDTWAKIVREVQAWNRNAGTITRSGLSKELVDTFVQKAVNQIPQALAQAHVKPIIVVPEISDAAFVGKCLLLASWNENYEADRDAVAGFLGMSYRECLENLRDLLHVANSPFSIKDGVWKVDNRFELLKSLGSRLLDQDLDSFLELAVTILGQFDPIFELPPKERYRSSIHSKVASYSIELRKGLAEGLALLGNSPSECSNCSLGKPETTAFLAVRILLTGADWRKWCSLDRLLPSLAESAPNEFLNAVDVSLRRSPSPFVELFSQEAEGVTGRNYITDVLLALEILAWDENLLVRVCLILAELASKDPGGQWGNRPFNSLVTILLPWCPQTLAPFDKHLVAVKTLLREFPEIAWKLILQLLPGKVTTSMGSHKPQWRQVVPEEQISQPSVDEYRNCVKELALLAVQAADHNADRLSELIKYLSVIPNPAFDRLMDVLQSQPVLEMPESQREFIWNALTLFTKKQRRFADARWALPKETLIRMDAIRSQIAPATPFFQHQFLFSNRDVDLYDEQGNWTEQQKTLLKRRDDAIWEIWNIQDIDTIFYFAAFVRSPHLVGFSLGSIQDSKIDHDLLPAYLDSKDNIKASLLSAYVKRRLMVCGWEWCDKVNMSTWTESQIVRFLFSLPFTEELWQRAEKSLGDRISQYWSFVNANPWEGEGDFSIAIEKLLEHNRPIAAIECIERMRHEEHPLDIEICLRALIMAAATPESLHRMDSYQVARLIGFLQSSDSVNQDDLLSIEWAFLPFLEGEHGVTPMLTEARLAKDPGFFCSMIRMIFKSQNENQPARDITDDVRRSAERAWQILHNWTTIPGIQPDGTFDSNKFNSWFDHVKALSESSGHLSVALLQIGELMIHAPPDPDGLWMNRAIAKALNERDADYLRRGFVNGTYNSRGVHFVDPTGKPERELAAENRRKANEMENAGFQRFAVTLRGIADGYDRKAEEVIRDHSA